MSRRLTAALYLRALALCYLAAFASFWAQYAGLIGSGGIWPAAETMQIVERSTGGGLEGWLRFPTLCWLGSGDGFLGGLCFFGFLGSIAAFLGGGSRWIWGWLLISYLSLVTIGRDFMSFQWDNLLLEAGLIALLLPPGTLVPSLSPLPAPSFATIALHQVLLFRLIFSSGVAKFTSGDEAWTGLTALRYHYETQPLPTPIGWWAHQLPNGFHTLSAGGVFLLQCLAPFLIFGPRAAKKWAFICVVGLQILIAATGNYGFFNLLALALALTLLDDETYARFLPARVRDSWLAPPPAARWVWPGRLFAAPVIVFVVVTGAFQLARTLDLSLSSSAQRWLSAVSPFRLVNPYGLFAVMTTERPEIVIEGTADGVHWYEYDFKYKAGRLDEGPSFVAPHLPRLDWQMWFAALGTAQQNRWFQRFMAHLGNASPEVLDLLERDPFAGRKPLALRAIIYRYNFTTIGERWETGAKWKRVELGTYWTSGEPPR